MRKEIIECFGIKLDSNTMWEDGEGGKYMKDSTHGTAYELIYGIDSDGSLDIVDLAEVCI